MKLPPRPAAVLHGSEAIWCFLSTYQRCWTSLTFCNFLLISIYRPYATFWVTFVDRTLQPCRTAYLSRYCWLDTHTHLFNGPCPGLPGWSGTRKVKPIWILLKQETVSGSGISWKICKSAPRSRRITPTPHHSVFYRPDALPLPNQQRQSTEDFLTIWEMNHDIK